MEDKEIINEENQEQENNQVEEPVEEQQDEQQQDELDSSILIEKPQPDDKPYHEVVEEERKAIMQANKKGQYVSTISIVVVVGLSIGGIFCLQTIPVLSYVLMGLAIAVLIVSSIINRRIARPDIRGYIVRASTAINRFTFADNRFQEVKYDPNDKIELEDVSADGVYKDLVRTASRNVCEGKYNGRTFKVCEAALFVPQGRKQAPAFIGKYFTFPNDLHFEGRILLISKGEQDADIPTDLDDLQQVVNEEKIFIYAPNEETLKVLDKKFIEAIKEIEVKKHMLNLTVAVWAGRTIVYASYDDATITLPFYEKYQEDTAVQYRDDLLRLLDACSILLKE